jgi:hypothetical protein
LRVSHKWIINGDTRHKEWINPSGKGLGPVKQMISGSILDSYIWKKLGRERRIHLVCPTDSLRRLVVTNGGGNSLYLYHGFMITQKKWWHTTHVCILLLAELLNFHSCLCIIRSLGHETIELMCCFCAYVGV